MKISPEDPILTAYALDELDQSSRTAVEQAFANDESLAREGAAISSLAGLMSETLQGENFSLGEERRDEILKAGRLPDADVLVLDHRKRSRRQSLLAVLGVAAVVTAGFIGLSQLQTSGPEISGGIEAANTGTGSDRGTAQLADDLVLGNGHSVVLPLDIEPVDPSFVEKSLAANGELPARELFQIEEWVNAGSLVSAPLVTIANVGMYAELGPCSWDEGKTLLLVNLRCLDGKGASVKATLDFNPKRVSLFHLLGSVESSASESPQEGEMRGDQTFLYQIALLPGEEQVGSINFEVEDEVAGYLPLKELPREEVEISNDFSMVRAFAEFAQWGKGNSRDPETLQRLANTAKDLLGEVTDEKARYALDMILLSEESYFKK